jgi:hypothetical protein
MIRLRRVFKRIRLRDTPHNLNRTFPLVLGRIRELGLKRSVSRTAFWRSILFGQDSAIEKHFYDKPVIRQLNRLSEKRRSFKRGLWGSCVATLMPHKGCDRGAEFLAKYEIRGRAVTIGQNSKIGGVALEWIPAQPSRLEQDLSQKPRTIVDGVLCGRIYDFVFQCRAIPGFPRGLLSLNSADTGSMSLSAGSHRPFSSFDLVPYREPLFGVGQYLAFQNPKGELPTVEAVYLEDGGHAWLKFDIPVERFLE